MCTYIKGLCRLLFRSADRQLRCRQKALRERRDGWHRNPSMARFAVISVNCCHCFGYCVPWMRPAQHGASFGVGLLFPMTLSFSWIIGTSVRQPWGKGHWYQKQRHLFLSFEGHRDYPELSGRVLVLACLSARQVSPDQACTEPGLFAWEPAAFLLPPPPVFRRRLRSLGPVSGLRSHSCALGTLME